MYEPVPIDQNLMRQPWFRKMQPFHSTLLLWSFYYIKDSIGVFEPEIILEDFYRMWKGFLEEGDIDLHQFIEDCNNDGKERMMWIDRGRKLWFCSTIIFRNSDKAGFRRMVDNQRDAAIIRSIANREETRDWFIEQAIYNDRLDVNKNLIISVHNAEKATQSQRDYTQRIAKKMGFKIPKGKNSPEAIKERYGCQCQYCGKSYDKNQLQIDHVHPQSSRHKDVNRTWNKVPACEECNRKKSNDNVFVFLKREGLELSTGVKIAVDKWVKKGVFEYPTQYGDKRNIKEKTFTWSQVVRYVSENAGVTTSDYQCLNPDAPVDQRKWKRK